MNCTVYWLCDLILRLVRFISLTRFFFSLQSVTRCISARQSKKARHLAALHRARHAYEHLKHLNVNCHTSPNYLFINLMKSVTAPQAAEHTTDSEQHDLIASTQRPTPSKTVSWVLSFNARDIKDLLEIVEDVLSLASKQLSAVSEKLCACALEIRNQFYYLRGSTKNQIYLAIPEKSTSEPSSLCRPKCIAQMEITKCYSTTLEDKDDRDRDKGDYSRKNEDDDDENSEEKGWSWRRRGVPPSLCQYGERGGQYGLSRLR